jgi:Flp pilus assembly secretin CpaC/tetratricopeptide (TPR) repeat protein
MRTRLHTFPLLFAAAVAPQLAPYALAEPAPEGQEPSVQDQSPEDRSPQASADEVLLRRQKRQSMAREFVALGNELYERADFKGALGRFAEALELDPENEEARSRFRAAEDALGVSASQAAETFKDDTDVLRIKREWARMEAARFSSTGDRLLREGLHDEAIQAYRKAEIVLRNYPLIATESLDERIVRSKLQEAAKLRDEAILEQSRVEQEAAAAAAREREQAERDRRENKLRSYYENANRSFVQQDYAQAEKWSDLILIADPGNQLARNLKDIAREARHDQTAARQRRDYREQWQRTFDELGTMNVPQTKAIQFDLERWLEVKDRQPLSQLQIQTTADPRREKVLEILDATIVTPKFGDESEGAPLASVAAFFQAQTNVNFYISNSVTDELDEEETSIRLNLNERSVLNVLQIIAETKENLRWKVEDGMVLFVTAAEMTGGQVRATYSVHDLIHPIPDYPGRDINVAPSGGLQPPDEDLPEREANVVTTGQLEELIRNNIATASWDADPGNSIRITETGTLVVNQTPEVQRQIQDLLADLREATGILVDIQTRFMRVEDNFLEDIGVDFRGLGLPGLGANGVALNDFGDGQSEFGQVVGQTSDLGAYFDDGQDGDFRARTEALYDTQLGTADFNGSGGLSFQWAFLNDLQLQLILRAVSKSERVELVTAPRIVVHNAARGNLSVLNQVAYVQDFDIEIAQAASIADPIIAVIQDGVILDVRPVVSADRRFVTLEMRPTIAQLERPIEEKPTSTGTQNTVNIMLPQVEIQRVRTSIPIPDGGTVLLGGLKESTNRDQLSGTPILNKIPVLSALFERKGTYISNKKLLILLNAQIVIPSELEPTNAELGIED